MAYISKREAANWGPDRPHPYHINNPTKYHPNGLLIITDKQIANLNGRKSWKKGDSGNPGGRGARKKLPKNVVKIAREAVARELVTQMGQRTALSAIEALKEQAVPIIKEIMNIALAPSELRVRKNPRTQEMEYYQRHTGEKIKALSLCVERIIPVLKVVEVDKGDVRKAHEMSDAEIIGLMAKMANMAGNRIEVKEQEELDG